MMMMMIRMITPITDAKGPQHWDMVTHELMLFLIFLSHMWMADVLRLTVYGPVHVPHAVWLVTFGSYSAFHLKFESLCGLSGLSVSREEEKEVRKRPKGWGPAAQGAHLPTAPLPSHRDSWEIMVQHRPKACLCVIILCFIILVIVADISELRPGMEILAYFPIILVYF